MLFFTRKRLTKDETGSYFILMCLLQASDIQIGRKGRFHFPQGYYIYTGSAMGGLLQRLKRICRCGFRRRLHWHIDYFIRYPLVQILEIYAVPEVFKNECVYNQKICQFPTATVPVQQFGSSDCKAGCKGHLIHFPSYPKGLWDYLDVKGELLPLNHFER